MRWIFQIIANMNNTYSDIIYKSKGFKNLAFIYKSLLILGIIACLILKYLKLSQIKNIKDEPKEEEKKDNEDNVSDDFYPDYELTHFSEERWRSLRK
jgi:hypothetical protein